VGRHRITKHGKRCSRSSYRPQLFRCRPQPASAHLPPRAHDVQERQAAACQVSQLCNHRVYDLCMHGPDAPLNATLVHGPYLHYERYRHLPSSVFDGGTDARRSGKTARHERTCPARHTRDVAVSGCATNAGVRHPFSRPMLYYCKALERCATRRAPINGPADCRGDAWWHAPCKPSRNGCFLNEESDCAAGDSLAHAGLGRQASTVPAAGRSPARPPQSPPVARQSAICLPGGPGALLTITAIPSHNDRGETAHVVRYGVGTPPRIGYDC
jgi:hypothetical protein